MQKFEKVFQNENCKTSEKSETSQNIKKEYTHLKDCIKRFNNALRLVLTSLFGVTTEFFGFNNCDEFRGIDRFFNFISFPFIQLGISIFIITFIPTTYYLFIGVYGIQGDTFENWFFFLIINATILILFVINLLILVAKCNNKYSGYILFI